MRERAHTLSFFTFYDQRVNCICHSYLFICSSISFDRRSISSSTQRIIEQFVKTPARVHACLFSTDYDHQQKHTRVCVCVRPKTAKKYTLRMERDGEKSIDRQYLYDVIELSHMPLHSTAVA